MRLYDETVLHGAIDIHIHVGPDYMPRYADSFTLAEEARDVGMRAIVIKNHLSSTAAAAHAATLKIPEVQVLGSIALNSTVGGINPRAAMAAIMSGAKVVWLPTVDARYGLVRAEEGHWIKHYVHSSAFGYESPSLTVIDETGKLKPETQEILRICHEHHVALCSGHISPQECLAVAKEAKKIGYKQFEITHPNAWTDDFTIDVMRELAACGAVLSISYGACSPRNGREDPEEIVHIIHEIGAQNCILMTDYGQTVSPSPAQGMRVFYYLMKSMGIEPSALDLMMKSNPAKLLNLN